MLTIMNEYGQLVYQKMTQTTSLDEVAADFLRIRARFEKRGFAVRSRLRISYLSEGC